MSFCYNSIGSKQIKEAVICNHHNSHHCVHSHSCTQKDHKRKQQSENTKSKKKINEIERIYKNEERQTCHFENDFKYEKSLINSEKLLSLLSQNQKEITQLKRKVSQLQIKLRKESHQKGDLQCQLNYYRQQFTNLIQCKSIDTKNEIKKRVEETKDLNLKINSIETRNKDLQTENKKFKEQRQQFEQKIENLKFNFEKAVSQNKDLSVKIKRLQTERKNLSENLQKRQRQTKKNEEKSRIMIAELKKNCLDQQQNKKALSLELQNLKIGKKNEQKKYKNEMQIGNIKLDQTAREIETLRIENQQILQEKEKLERDLKQLKDRNNCILQELNHTKRLIQIKASSFNRQSQKEKREKDVLTEKNVQLKEKKNDEKMENVGNSEEEMLKKQVQMLKQQIQNMKLENIRNIQEVILKIGASQAFKRIVDDKNRIIKQLMREKAEIKSVAILGNHIH